MCRVINIAAWCYSWVLDNLPFPWRYLILTSVLRRTKWVTIWAEKKKIYHRRSWQSHENYIKVSLLSRFTLLSPLIICILIFINILKFFNITRLDNYITWTPSYSILFNTDDGGARQMATSGKSHRKWIQSKINPSAHLSICLCPLKHMIKYWQEKGWGAK